MKRHCSKRAIIKEISQLFRNEPLNKKQKISQLCNNFKEIVIKLLLNFEKTIAVMEERCYTEA